MSYSQNTPFQTNCVFLNTKDSNKEGNEYNFNLDSALRCPLNTNFIVSVQDCEIPNTINNITSNNNRLQFQINNYNIELINFGNTTGGINGYTSFLTANNFDYWNINNLWTPQTIDGVVYQTPYYSGVSVIRKYLPNFFGELTVVYKNPYPATSMQLLIDGVVKQTLSPNSAVTTYTTTFSPNQLLQFQTNLGGGIICILSISTKLIEPKETFPSITFPPNYYTAYTFRDYFNNNFASQNPTYNNITLVYDKTQYKYNFSSNHLFYITNKDRQNTDLDFGGLSTTTLFSNFCNTNNLETTCTVAATVIKNQIAYPSLTGSTTQSNILYTLPNYNGQLTIRAGLSSGTGGIALSLNNIQQGSLLTTSDVRRVISFVANDVFRITRNNNQFVIFSLDIVESEQTTITNPCNDVIGLDKDRTRDYILPVVSTNNPMWTIYLPSLVNFLAATHIFIKFQNIALNNLNSLGNSDNTLVRIPVNAPRGNIIFYRPTELVSFIIPKKRINNFNLFIVDSNNTPLDLGGMDFQINLRFDYHYAEDLKDLEEGSINHTLKKLSKELPDEPPIKEPGLG